MIKMKFSSQYLGRALILTARFHACMYVFFIQVEEKRDVWVSSALQWYGKQCEDKTSLSSGYSRSTEDDTDMSLMVTLHGVDLDSHHMTLPPGKKQNTAMLGHSFQCTQ